MSFGQFKSREATVVAAFQESFSDAHDRADLDFFRPGANVGIAAGGRLQSQGAGTDDIALSQDRQVLAGRNEGVDDVDVVAEVGFRNHVGAVWMQRDLDHVVRATVMDHF